MVAACVIPIPAEVETTDAGGRNSPPVIVSSMPAMPGPITLFVNDTNPPDYSVTIKDIDAGDTLYMRVFRDYLVAAPFPPLVDRQIPAAPGSTEVLRTREIPTTTLCNLAALDEQLIFDVVVSDRPFSDDPSVQPAYQASPGGEVTVRSWVGRCIEQ